MDVYKQIKEGPLSEYMDTSNFDVNHECYSEKNKGKLGLLKSETGGIPIKETIYLSPKCYSILLDDGNIKNTAKGINKSEKIKLRHELYNKVHSGDSIPVKATCSNIRSNENNLYTMQMQKNALVKLDRKRYWDDHNKSYGYGHPAIIKKKYR